MPFLQTCKSQKFPAPYRNPKKKKGFTGARTLNIVIELFEYSRYAYCAIESLVKNHL